MTTTSPSAVVIGIGNEVRGDDGAGIAVAHLLREQLPSEVCILTESGEATSLMDAWRDAAWVVLADAVQSGAPPGTIHHFDGSAGWIPSGLFPCSTHGFGLAEAIEMARALHELPPHLIVYGIEGKTFTDIKGLSAEVEYAVAEVAKQIVQELRTASCFDSLVPR